MKGSPSAYHCLVQSIITKSSSCRADQKKTLTFHTNVKDSEVKVSIRPSKKRN